MLVLTRKHGVLDIPSIGGLVVLSGKTGHWVFL